MEHLTDSGRVRVHQLVFHMVAVNRFAQIVRFGVFEADLQTGELHKNGVRVSLQGQPFQVCAILLERSGELVTREELRQKVWPEDTFVDFDQALNTAITKIRIALGDDADNPRFVETLPRRGYRFIAPVEKPSLQAHPPRAPKERFERLRAKARWISVGATLLALLSGIGVWRFSRKTAVSMPSVEVVPLVAVQGKQAFPAFSPDGNQVAFAGYGPLNSDGLYTVLIEGEKPLKLTNNPGDYCATWSPDGRQIAFLRDSIHAREIYVISALGGTERRLYGGPPNVFTRGLSWSPDGAVLAFPEGNNEDGIHSRIALLSLADLTVRPLTSPPDQERDEVPSFSPDGLNVAFLRVSVAGAGAELFVAATKGGEPKRLTFDNAGVGGSIAWTHDGREIVFASPRGGLVNLWRIFSSGGTPQPVAGVGARAWNPSIPLRGDRLAYQHTLESDNIWRVDLEDARRAHQPVRVISSRGMNWRPSFSPDGKKIAFESDRAGFSEIWVCDSDGSNCTQFTSLRGIAGAARWSPDGHYIAFEFHLKEHYEIYVLEVTGGPPRRIPTFPGTDNGAPSWSRNGQSIYFYSVDGGGHFQLWKVPLRGGPAIQVTKNGGIYAIESEDGRFLYYSKFEQPGIWKMPLAGGQEVRVLDQPEGFDWFNWGLARNGIYFLKLRYGGNVPGPTGTMDFLDFGTGRTTPIITLDKAVPNFGGLAVSPDGRSILYGQVEIEDSYVMLVKHFR